MADILASIVKIGSSTGLTDCIDDPNVKFF
ncbi:hypothetical protein COLO4_26344 [Corchorus olitorius]|uniref:Uncharacterized protein n=1 Tax=Corchorus olitorius TaxID=93759 RepID=A0A1R3HXI0_9ROSI|nr:hypothetical protein COLO4_26344 [Corchorus olitorius]